MRILIITGSFPPMRCGVGDYSCNLAKALADVPEVNVGILTSAFDGVMDTINGIEIFPVIKEWNRAEALIVMKIIRHWSPDIVHIQYPTQGYGAGILPWLLPMISFIMGKKVVQTWHEEYSSLQKQEFFLKSIIPGSLVLMHPSYKELLPPKLRWVLWIKKPVFIPIASNIPIFNIDEHKKDILRRRYLENQKRLIVFFGFVYPTKGIELLFEIADPALDQIVIAGEIGDGVGYHQEIIERASVGSWIGKTIITGFLPTVDISALLSVADAVILPFRGGGGELNKGSVYAAVSHGVFTITTSLTQNGYDKKHNIYYAKVDDVKEMKAALNAYSGKRRRHDVDIDRDKWQDIANQHIKLYRQRITG